MAASTLTTYDALLFERYIDSSRVEKLMYPDNVLLGLLEKRGDTGMVGSDMPIPIITKNPQGAGGAFATAQTNASAIGASKFATTAGDYYGVVHIGDKVMMASRTNAGAFLENKTTEIDGLWETCAENLSIYAWGNGGGSLGSIASIAGNALTLAEPEKIGNFEIDMVVVASADDGSDASHTLRTGSDAIDAINRSTGVLDFDNVADITGLAVGDSLFRQSDFFGDTATVVLKGVQTYITATDSPMALWGLTAANRAVDPQRFAGCRVDSGLLQGKTIEERIKILASQMTGRFKAKMPTAGFLHPEDFATLDTQLSSRGVRPLEDDSTQFGYMKIDVVCGSGRMPIYTDRHCPKGTFFALRMEDWWMSSMGEFLHPQTSDGNTVLRRATATDLEYRLISYPILANRAPKNSGRCPLV